MKLDGQSSLGFFFTLLPVFTSITLASCSMSMRPITGTASPKSTETSPSTSVGTILGATPVR